MKEKKVEMDDLQKWWEVPAIAHFFHLFSTPFDLIDFEIEDFEETLLLDGTENVTSFIPDIIVRLLRGLYKTRNSLQVTLDNYDYYLRDLLEFHYKTNCSKENPVADMDFKALKTRTKVEILWNMCNWRLELEDVADLIKNVDSDDLRVQPVGTDSAGNTYWYFYGVRLYVEKTEVFEEEKPKKPGKQVSKLSLKRTKSGRTIKKRNKNDESSDEDEPNILTRIRTTSKDVWSLSCSSIHDWHCLYEQLKSSKLKKDKTLLLKMQSLYESVKILCTTKEAAMQKKLLLMAPRRVSDRITIKMKQRDEEERLQEEERVLRSQQKVKEMEERQKQLEEIKLKEREQRYYKREKLLENRALRAKQRETQKLVAGNPGLVKALKQSTNKQTSESENESEEWNVEEEDKYSIMERVINNLIEHEDSWPFEEPVNEDEAPDYYTFIKKPMDFQTIMNKIKNKIYKDELQFEQDVLLVFDNCETYNGTYSSFTKLAMKIKKLFEKQMKQEFPPDFDEDDDDFFEEDELPKLKKRRLTTDGQVKSLKPLYEPVTKQLFTVKSAAKYTPGGLAPSLKYQKIAPVATTPCSVFNIKPVHQKLLITTSNPLHQLADTALGSTTLNLRASSLNPRSDVGMVSTRCDSLAKSFVVQQPLQNPVKVPITIKWEELKKQLMMQMKSTGASIPEDSPRWDEVKKQILAQMNGTNAPKVVYNNVNTAIRTPVPLASLSGTLPALPTAVKTNILPKTVVSTATLHVNHFVQSSFSKVENWLNSSRPFGSEMGKVLQTSQELTSLTGANTPRKVSVSPGKDIYMNKLVNKPTTLDLQRAALQAAAVNQISTKLHSHLQNAANTNPVRTQTSVVSTPLVAFKQQPSDQVTLSRHKALNNQTQILFNSKQPLIAKLNGNAASVHLIGSPLMKQTSSSLLKTLVPHSVTLTTTLPSTVAKNPLASTTQSKSTVRFLSFPSNNGKHSSVVVSASQVLVPKHAVNQNVRYIIPAQSPVILPQNRNNGTHNSTCSNNQVTCNGSKPIKTQQIASVLTTSSASITEKPKQLLIDVSQLQKLKDEGRIAVTPTGQLVMLSPSQAMKN